MFYSIKQKPSEKKVLRFDYERDYVVNCFKAYLEDSQISEEIKKIDRVNYNVKNCLYQKDFDIVIQHAYAYIQGCCKEIMDLKMIEDDSQESYQKELDNLYIKYRNEENYFKEKLKMLNNKLNKFIE